MPAHARVSRHLFLFSLLLTTFALPTRAQQAPAQSQEDETVVRISSELVQTDVTVTDASGRFVDGLQREQFELLVDDEKASEADLMGTLVNDKGDVVSSVRQRLARCASSKGGRMVYTLQFPNVAPGLYQVRAAALDSAGGRAGGAREWVEVPDLSKGEFALSDLFLSEVASGASQASPVSADRRFPRASRVRFQAQIYNAAHAPSINLTLELKLSSNGRTIIETPPPPVSIEGVKDLAHIPVTGEFPLEGFAPGVYEMEMNVTDRVAGKGASQQVVFVVE